jgi:hypothetical protein
MYDISYMKYTCIQLHVYTAIVYIMPSGSMKVKGVEDVTAGGVIEA